LNHLVLGRRTRLDLPHVTAFTPGAQSRMWSLDLSWCSNRKVLRRPGEGCAIVKELQWAARMNSQLLHGRHAR
jgi:hypothetical protein